MDRKSPVDAHIGQRLKEYRRLRGMTVRELADAAHVTPGQISHYEHGRDRISHERITEFARIKLQTDLSQREAPNNVSEKGDLALALESAIDRVETVYSKHDHLRSLDRLTNSSEVDASEITIEGRKSALIIRPPPPILLICPAFRLESWVTAGRPSPHGTGWAPHPWQGRPWSLCSLSCCARCCIVNSAFSDAKPRSRSRRCTKLRDRKRNRLSKRLQTTFSCQ